MRLATGLPISSLIPAVRRTMLCQAALDRLPHAAPGLPQSLARLLGELRRALSGSLSPARPATLTAATLSAALTAVALASAALTAVALTLGRPVRSALTRRWALARTRPCRPGSVRSALVGRTGPIGTRPGRARNGSGRC